jgi:hypothetical protein
MGERAQHLYDVFISYSHADRTWVWNELLPQLEGAGLKVCIDDRDFEIGIPSLVNMERAVDNSRHTLAVLTPEWIQSQWTEFESLLVGTADPAGRTRKLMPLILRSCTPPQRIAMLTHVNFAQRGLVDPFKRLLQQLLSISEEAKPRRAGKHRKQQSQPQPLAAPRMRRSFSEALSPFIAGLPVTDPQRFFGRERELKRLFNLWKYPPLQNAAIIGPARSGKTSLLLYLRSIASTVITHPPYRWIFVDFQDPRMGSRERLLSHLLDSLGFPAPSPCNIDDFLDIVAGNLQTPTVILLDEVGVALQRYPELDDEFWEGLRSLASSQVDGKLGFILSSHALPVQIAHNSGHSSPFFNIFGYTAFIGPLTEPEARELIASTPIPFLPDDIEWILDRSGRWPILLQILCRECLEVIQEGKSDDTWREDAILQIAPFIHLLR